MGRGEARVKNETENAASTPSIEVHIDEIHLRGFSFANDHGVREALERELTTLLSMDGAALAVAQGHGLGSGAERSVDLAADSSPETIGIRLAGVLHGGSSR